jgi:hypothetical protein
MVNVASQIPFNLHNTVLPPSRSYGSVSRSTSWSLDQHSRDQHYQIDYSKHMGVGHQQNFYASAFNDRSRSSSPSSGPIVEQSPHTKCLSRTSTPIFNVRLVGYTDNMTKPRGRTLSRSTDIRNLTNGTTRIEGEEVATTTTNAETSEGLVRLFCAVKLFFIGLTFIVRILRPQLALSNFVMSGQLR